MFFKRPKQTSNDNLPPASPAKPSLIASDAVFEGNLTVDGEVRVDGTMRGSIRAQLCIVEANGIVEGEIAADEIIVRGRVVGPLRAYHVHLQSGAHVEGDVINETIAVDSGARLQGSVWRSEDPFASEAPDDRVQQPKEPPSYLRSPLWTGSDPDSYRPLTAIRPR